MTFEIVRKEVNAIRSDCFDLHIYNSDTQEMVIFYSVKTWSEDQEALEGMFYYGSAAYLDHLSEGRSDLDAK